MHKYGESKRTRIMAATVRHVTSSSGLRKFQADGLLFDWVYSTHLQIVKFKKEEQSWIVQVFRYALSSTMKTSFYFSYVSCKCTANVHETNLHAHVTVSLLHEILTTQTFSELTFWRRNYFFLILAHPVYKTWIIQEPNTLELWNKLHFLKRKNGEYIPCLKYSVPIFVE